MPALANHRRGKIHITDNHTDLQESKPPASEPCGVHDAVAARNRTRSSSLNGSMESQRGFESKDDALAVKSCVVEAHVSIQCIDRRARQGTTSTCITSSHTVPHRAHLLPRLTSLTAACQPYSRGGLHKFPRNHHSASVGQRHVVGPRLHTIVTIASLSNIGRIPWADDVFGLCRHHRTKASS